MADKLKTYNTEEAEARIRELKLDGWNLGDGWLRRKYNPDGWRGTLLLVNTLGFLCKAAYHDADLAVTWVRVWVKPRTS